MRSSIFGVVIKMRKAVFNVAYNDAVMSFIEYSIEE